MHINYLCQDDGKKLWSDFTMHIWQFCLITLAACQGWSGLILLARRAMSEEVVIVLCSYGGSPEIVVTSQLHSNWSVNLIGLLSTPLQTPVKL